MKKLLLAGLCFITLPQTSMAGIDYHLKFNISGFEITDNNVSIFTPNRLDADIEVYKSSMSLNGTLFRDDASGVLPISGTCFNAVDENGNESIDCSGAFYKFLGFRISLNPNLDGTIETWDIRGNEINGTLVDTGSLELTHLE